MKLELLSGQKQETVLRQKIQNHYCILLFSFLWRLLVIPSRFMTFCSLQLVTTAELSIHTTIWHRFFAGCSSWCNPPISLGPETRVAGAWALARNRIQAFRMACERPTTEPPLEEMMISKHNTSVCRDLLDTHPTWLCVECFPHVLRHAVVRSLVCWVAWFGHGGASLLEKCVVTGIGEGARGRWHCHPGAPCYSVLGRHGMIWWRWRRERGVKTPKGLQFC